MYLLNYSKFVYELGRGDIIYIYAKCIFTFDTQAVSLGKQLIPNDKKD